MGRLILPTYYLNLSVEKYFIIQFNGNRLRNSID